MYIGDIVLNQFRVLIYIILMIIWYALFQKSSLKKEEWGIINSHE